MTIKEALKSPLAKVSAGITGILAVLNPDVWFVALDALLVSGPQLFSGLGRRADAAACVPARQYGRLGRRRGGRAVRGVLAAGYSSEFRDKRTMRDTETDGTVSNRAATRGESQ